MKKIFPAGLLLFCTTLLFSAPKHPKQVRIGVLNGPSAIPCAYMIEHKDSSGIKNLEFENCTSAQTELPKLIKGELDFGFLPPNAAAKVFTTAKEALLCLGITGNGNLFLISKNTDYSGLASLKGKTVYCAGQGATPEYMFRHLLSKNQIETSGENSVTLDFSIPNANLAAAVISGKAEYALVPEPFATVATLKDPSIRRISSIQALYATQSAGASYPMTLLVVNAKFARENKETVAKVIEAYKKSSEWTLRNPAHAGALVEKLNLGLNAKIAEKSIQNAAYTWISAAEGRPQIESLLTIFLESSKESVGGKLPSENFYYSAGK